tara:strand:- start:40831 stop:40965 length:135 start_codon:yes stop_codon:yes gene_type:complete
MMGKAREVGHTPNQRNPVPALGSNQARRVENALQRSAEPGLSAA